MKSRRNVHFYTIPTEDIPSRLANEYHQLLDQFELDGRTFLAVIVDDDIRTVFLLEKIASNTYESVSSEDFDNVVSVFCRRQYT